MEDYGVLKINVIFKSRLKWELAYHLTLIFEKQNEKNAENNDSFNIVLINISRISYKR